MKTLKGQSLLELAAVITLIAVAIFFAGPTVIRGVNAHFKIWDDSIQDSYSDPFQETNVALLSTTCTCSDTIGGVGTRCGVSPCKTNEHLETRICSPAGCAQALNDPAHWTVKCV